MTATMVNDADASAATGARDAGDGADDYNDDDGVVMMLIVKMCPVVLLMMLVIRAFYADDTVRSHDVYDIHSACDVDLCMMLITLLTLLTFWQ